MRQKLATVLSVCAIVIVLLYGWMIMEHYAGYLDISLRYVPHSVREAREDVLGLGFWPMWLVVFVIWSIFELPAFLLSGNRRQLALVGVLFLIASIVDFYLAGVLARQVP